MTRRDLGIIVTGILGSSMVMLGETVVNLALPHIATTFGVPFSTLQWVVEGYNLVLSALILFGGSLGDLVGLRRMYLLSTALFIVLSLLCALAWSPIVLIVLRAFLGLAGALLTPVSLALLNAQLPSHLRGRAIGYWTAWTSIVLALGPLVGGYFVDAFSWRAIFLANIPLGIVAFVLGIASLQEKISRIKISIDWLGVLLGFFALGGITYGLIEGPTLSWSAPTVFGLVVGIILFAIFIWWEDRAAHPLVELGLFKNRNFSATNAATFFLYAALAGFSFVFTIFLQTTGGYSAFQAGASMLPVAAVLALFSGRVGGWATKRGPRLFMTAGPFICALGMLYMLDLGPHVSYVTGIFPGVLLFAIGLVLVVAPLTATALNSAPDEKSGIASAINNGAASVGPLIAIALLGLWGSQNIYGYAIVLCAAMAVAAGIISLIFVRKPQIQ